MNIIVASVGGAVLLSLPAALNGMPFLYYDSAEYMARPDGPLRMLAGLVGLSPESVGLPPGVEANPPAAMPAPPAAMDFAAAAPTADLLPMPAALSSGPEAAPTVAVATERPLMLRGRSIFYRAFGWAGHALGGLWPVVFAQAAMTAATLAIFWRHVAGGRGTGSFLALVAGLALLTPLGFFTGLVMPDAMAGPLILVAALFAAAWPRLGTGERLVLGAVAVFAMLTHSSHAALGAALAATGLGLRLVAPTLRARLSGAGLAALALATAVGIGGETTANALLAGRTGEAPISRPHLSAHLTDGGPGLAWLDRHCPGAEAGPEAAAPFVLCRYRDRLPLEWRLFLFSPDPAAGVFMAAPRADRRALSEEQFRFAAAVFADDPLGMIGFAAREAARQVVWFSVHEVRIQPHFAGEAAGWFPDGVYAAAEASPIGRHRPIMLGLTWLAYAGAIAGIGALVWAALRLPRAPRAPGAAAAEAEAVAITAIGVILVGLLANAAICGVLASPYPRFQARVIWLLPLAGLAAAALVATRRPSAPHDRKAT